MRPMRKHGQVVSCGSMAHDRLEGPMTESLGFIDVNVQFGPVAGGARGAPMATVVGERDRHGVRTSLVRHRTALLGEATLGNETLLDEIAGDPGFAPVGV